MSKTLLLHATKSSDAVAEIARLGGRVTQHLTPNILLAKVDEHLDGRQLSSATSEIPTELDEYSKLAVQAWRLRVNRTWSQKEIDTHGLGWDSPGFEQPQTDGGHVHRAAVAVRPQAVVNNDRLTGRVAIGLVMVSGSGTNQGFTSDEILNMIGQTAEATQYWTSVEPAADISFVYENFPVTIPGEMQVPNTTMSSGLSAAVYKDKVYAFHQGTKEDQLWYNEFDGTNWTGDQQVPNTSASSDLSTAVLNDKLYCFHQGLKPDEIWYNVFDGSWAGDVQVPKTSTSSCLSVVNYNGKLYCFHQGSSNNQLWYNVFDGTTWTGDIQVPNTSTSMDISVAIYNGELYCFHSGVDPTQLWYNAFDGTSWQGDIQVADTVLSTGLSAVVFGGAIYCFHQGAGSPNLMYVNIYTGLFWSGVQVLDGTVLSAAPSAVAFGNQIYCFHQDYRANGQLWYRPFDLISPGFYAGDYDVLESVWRNPVLKQMGYSQDMAGCIDFANSLCQKHNTTRAYLAFFTKFPLSHFGYAAINGVRTCMSYVNDGWGPENIYKVFAHETGHIFGAGDEYLSCDPEYGLYKVKNGNNIDHTTHQADCLMNNNILELCTFSKGQLGWLPRLGLFVFHQSPGASASESGTISYSVFDGQAWWDDRLVPDSATFSNPSAVEYRDQVYCFHQGGSAGGALWFNVFDGANWSGDVEIPSTPMSAAPSATLFQDKIFCFHQGAGDNGTLWFNTFDGSNWAGDVQLPNTHITDTPSAVVYDNVLYCFHEGSSNDGTLWYTALDGKIWAGDKQVPNTSISGNPATAVFNDKLYCVHQGPKKNGTLWYNVFDGKTWAGDVQVPNTESAAAPSAMVYTDKLYCVHAGSKGDGSLWYNAFDGKRWASDKIVPNTGFIVGPSTATAKFQAGQEAALGGATSSGSVNPPG
ncbi:hypothetical protein MMC25_007248 [Agyrium rufum]|nr:hypothetical protein [Agyrium rufum]